MLAFVGYKLLKRVPFGSLCDEKRSVYMYIHVVIFYRKQGK